MKSNLLSLDKVLEKGYKMIMGDNVLKVHDDKKSLILKFPVSKKQNFQNRYSSVGAKMLCIIYE